MLVESGERLVAGPGSQWEKRQFQLHPETGDPASPLQGTWNACLWSVYNSSSGTLPFRPLPVTGPGRGDEAPSRRKISFQPAPSLIALGIFFVDLLTARCRGLPGWCVGVAPVLQVAVRNGVLR
jgi:hypothetical protein